MTSAMIHCCHKEGHLFFIGGTKCEVCGKRIYMG